MNKINLLILTSVFLMGVSFVHAMNGEENEPKQTSIQYKAPSEFQTEDIGFVLTGGYSVMDRTDDTQETRYLITDPLRPCVGIVIIGDQKISFGHKSFYNICKPKTLCHPDQPPEGIERIILYSAKVNEKEYLEKDMGIHDWRSQEEELSYIKSLFVASFSKAIENIGGRIETYVQEGRFNGTLGVSSAGEVFNTSFEETIKKVGGQRELRMRSIDGRLEIAAVAPQIEHIKKCGVYPFPWNERTINRKFLKYDQYGLYEMFPCNRKLKDLLD